EGTTVKGMAFTLYNGGATWDSAGRLSGPIVSVSATTSVASRVNSQSGVFTFTRSGDTTASMSVSYSLGGTAMGGTDYQLLPTSATSIAFPAGAASVALSVVPKTAT